MSTGAAARCLQESGLPARWQGRDRFVVLDVGAGSIRTFLTAWRLWRADPQRCATLHVIAVGASLCMDLDAALDALPLDAAARSLAAAWPPLTPNLHRLGFENGAVELLLAPGLPEVLLREIVASVDAFVVSDETGEGAGAAVSIAPLSKAMARLAAAHATLAVTRFDEPADLAFRTAGFSGFRVEARRERHVGEAPDALADEGAGQISVAHFAPRVAPRSLDLRRRDIATEPTGRDVTIVGAGLAGCAAAWALAGRGWRCTILERASTAANAASGNPAGIFHGIVNGQDGTHARFNRAAALEAQRMATVAIRRHRVAGGLDGQLQLADVDVTVGAMRARLERLGLPPGYVEALDASEASARAGFPVSRTAWFYPAGGWIDPAGLARAFLAEAGTLAHLRTEADVASMHRDGTHWVLLDAGSQVLARSATVVLANAGGALELAAGPWPVEAVRGQISRLPSTAASATMPLPRLPMSGDGYLIPGAEGSVVFGATADRDDPDPEVRLADHRRNLVQLARLAGSAAAAIDVADLHGRTAWRCVSRDRLPLIGAVPVPAASSEFAVRADQPRFVPRETGLFMFTALGSRGITWAALGAQVLAAIVTGAPVPIESSLLDAVDPARFRVREGRRTRSA